MKQKILIKDEYGQNPTLKELDNKYIIKTSNLGHDVSVYEVETDMPIDKIKEIDKKYGMKYRHQSTIISQLENGAIQEGYNFKIKEIIRNSNNFEKYHHNLKHDYFANTGNY